MLAVIIQFWRHVLHRKTEWRILINSICCETQSSCCCQRFEKLDCSKKHWTVTQKCVILIQSDRSVSMTVRSHLFPFRTQKLSSLVPKIVRWKRRVKIGSRRLESNPWEVSSQGFFVVSGWIWSGFGKGSRNTAFAWIFYEKYGLFLKIHKILKFAMQKSCGNVTVMLQ